MNSEHSFIAERKAAQHCAELLRRGPEPVDPVPALARLGERIARQIAPLLAELLGGESPSVAALTPNELSEAELIEQVGPLAANSLLAPGAPGVTLLASVDGAALLRLVDRAFGGKGDSAGAMPEVFPLSAELMIQRLEASITQSLGEALGHADVRALCRHASLAELAPFPAGAKLIALQLEVLEDAKAPWRLTFALPLASLPKLLASGDGAAKVTSSPPQAADPAAAPFADVPIPVTATLVDMQISLAAIAALEPGSVLPVAVARAVPLAIGAATIAHGTIGAQDDRVAVRLTQLAC